MMNLMNWLQKNLDNRRVFLDTLLEINDSKNLIVTCDVGFSYLDDPKYKTIKVFNFGVTEQSSAIISAGLALSGYTVWFYSMINFVVFRPYEMVRNAICHHNANVKLVGVKGSEAYKFLGFSHNLDSPQEDFNAVKDMPNIELHEAQDVEHVKKIVKFENSRIGPCYIRL